MRHRTNRSSSLPLALGLCLIWTLAPQAAAAPAAGAGVPWQCEPDGAGGWRCRGAAAPTAQGSERARAPAAAARPSGAAPAPRDPALARRYWVPRADLPPAALTRLPEFCVGAYVGPTFPHPLGSDPESFPLLAAAERASYEADGEVRLDGGVRIDRGNRSVQADSGTLHRSSGDGSLTGDVLLLEPGLALQGDSAQLNIDSGAAELDTVQFLFLDTELRGDAVSLSQDAAGNLAMTRGSFTRCEPGNDNWRISARSVEVEEGDNFGTARHAVLRVKQVPVMYTPYIRFPVNDERQSGWLFPNIGYSDEDGTDLTLPYYLNLAPDYDATLIPRYVSDRGIGLEGELRHLSGWQESVLSGAYLHKDDLYNGELDREDFEDLEAQGLVSGEFEPEDRWLYALEHRGGFGRFDTIIDYTAVSDRDYFRGLGTDLGVSSQIELERRGELRYNAGNLFVRAWAQRFQRLDENTTDVYQRLPELELGYAGDLPGPLEWSVGTEWVSFHRDNDALGGLNRANGDRLHLEPRVSLPLSASWGFLTLTGGYRYTQYDLDSLPVGFDESPDRGIGFGSAHTGLFFERDLDLFGTGLVQTLEPELFYLYQEFEDQSALPRFDAAELTFSYRQLFRDNRFSGTDRIGDANQVSAGLTTRFLDAASGREYLRASVGEIIYLEDRRVTLVGSPGEDEFHSTSAIAGELSSQFARHWRVTGTAIWDPHDDRVDEGAFSLQYRRDNRHIVNLGYRSRLGEGNQDDIDQSDVSLYWPMSRHFSLLGRWNYDLKSGRTIEGFGGLEYNDCCWQVRLIARRFIDSPTGRDLDTVKPDDGIFLQIVFKGLAGFGTKIESVLERGIRGYRTEEIHGF